MPNVLDRAKAFVTGDDADRLERRREIKQELAGLEAIAGRHKAIGDQLRTVDLREAKAVAAHEATCQPIQSRLLEIENEITDLILADEPVTDKLAGERAAALEKLSTANSKLEAEVEVLKKLRRRMELDRNALASQVGQITAVRNKLTVPGIARPDLLIALFVANEHALWTDKRLKAAERELRTLQGTLAVQQRERESRRHTNSRGVVVDDPQPGANELQLSREVDGWAAEVAAAHQAVADAFAWKKDIQQQIVAE